MQFRILYQDEQLVAIDKPAGFQVHPPSDPRHTISRGSNCLYLLNRQLGKFLYPVHRLDRATSGALIFALSSEAASTLQNRFRTGQVTKTYYAVTRGWTDDQGEIAHPLQADDEPAPKPALTRYRTLARLEKPTPIGPYPSARYSLVEVNPGTGRFHQIRRHFSHISHPLIGDTVHGDGRHNRNFRELLGDRLLLLKAYSLEIPHPTTDEPLRFQSRWSGAWHRVFDLFGICPFSARPRRG